MRLINPLVLFTPLSWIFEDIGAKEVIIIIINHVIIHNNNNVYSLAAIVAEKYNKNSTTDNTFINVYY